MSLDPIPHVLIVEDDDNDVALLYPELNRPEHERRLAWHRVHTQAEAEAWLLHNRCDAIALDLGLPDARDPMELLATMLGMCRGAAIVVVTGYDVPGMRSQFIAHGADSVLIKDRASPTEIAEIIEGTVARRRTWGAPPIEAIRDAVHAIRADVERLVVQEERACRRFAELNADNRQLLVQLNGALGRGDDDTR